MTNTRQQSTELNCVCHNQSKQQRRGTELRQSLGNIAATGSRWHSRSRQRQALAALDSHLLDDIGVTRSAATREARKPFWS
jgi:uncharacterized protein YjiS (DUF1127 family)